MGMVYTEERIVRKHDTIRKWKCFHMSPVRVWELRETESEEVERSQIAKGLFAILRK